VTEQLIGFLQQYGYGLVFVSIFLESTGLPFPGESILIAAGIMAGHGQLDVHLIFLASWIAGTLGDNCGYYLGHRFGHRFILRYGRRLGITPAKYAYVEREFRRWGPPIVLFARFILILRQLCGAAAGTLRFPWWRFLFFNALGAALWSGTYTYGAYLFGNQVDRLLHGNPWAYVALAVVFLGLTVATILRFRRGLKNLPDEDELPFSEEGGEGGPSLR
jgi:membrane protein DedA with SNARE-associated domain